MTNMFDQYDEAPQVNMFDQYDQQPVQADAVRSSDPYRSAKFPASELLRGALGAAPRIVDFADRVAPWAYNTLRPSSWPAVDYPPSLNQSIQGGLTKLGLPEAETPGEKVASGALQNVMFGPAGVLGGATASGIQQVPAGHENIKVAGRDIGMSPNDLAATGASMLAMGALAPKPLVMNDIKNSEAGRVAQINMKNNIPVYTTDAVPENSVTGATLHFMNATPLSGKMGRGAEQAEALARGVTKAMGEDSSELTPKVMDSADKRIGGVFQKFGQDNDVLPQAVGNLQNSLTKYQADNLKYMTSDNARRLQAHIDEIKGKSNVSSLLKDETGNPLLVYHGTPRGFSDFNNEGPHFFTDDPSVAADYAKEGFMGENTQSNIRPSYLNLKNPKIIDAEGKEWSNLGKGGTSSNYEAILARNEGHDGLIIKNIKDNVAGNDAKDVRPSNVYVAFDKDSVVPKFGVGMKGQDWSSLQSDLGRRARTTADPEYSQGLYDVQNFLRGSMRSSVPASEYGKFDTANSQYRAMLALEPAAKKAIGNGVVSPNALLQGADRIYPNTIYDDPNPIPQLAQGAQMLKNAQSYAGKYQNELWKTPAEFGKVASYAATPFGALFNRTLNTELTPMDFSHPWLSAAYRAMLAGSAVPFSLAPQQGK